MFQLQTITLRPRDPHLRLLVGMWTPCLLFRSTKKYTKVPWLTQGTKGNDPYRTILTIEQTIWQMCIHPLLLLFVHFITHWDWHQAQFASGPLHLPMAQPVSPRQDAPISLSQMPVEHPFINQQGNPNQVCVSCPLCLLQII